MTIHNPLCLRCNRSNLEINDLKTELETECKGCGLRMQKDDREDGQWVVVRGNLDLAWFTQEIILPEKLEVHGDLNLTGCTGIRKDCLKSLIIHGNMFICNVEKFEKLPEVECRIKGSLFASNTFFSEQNKDFNGKIKTKWTSSEVEEIWKEQNKFDKLKKKLPEFEGIL